MKTKASVKPSHISPIFLIIFSLFLFFSKYPQTTESANLNNVKDTLQSSRLSWSARVEADGTDEGNSRVQIQSAPDVPYNATSTNNLHAGDAITINSNSYTVIDIIDADEFTVSPVVQSSDADDGDPIQLKHKPRHLITFTTASAVANGFFRILIPADSTTPADGNVDDEGFDFTTGSIDVTTTNQSGYTFVSGVATASGGTGCTSPSNYHCFEVHYSGSGGIGTTITINIGNTNASNSLIAPTEIASHTEATADTYSFQIRNYDGSDNLIDSATGKIALIEAVRVTATVDPTINFSIAGVGTGTTVCGVPASVTSTALSVPFGSMSLNTFKTAAQQLTVSTNATGGYVVTAKEDDELGKDGATTPLIPDTDCDGEDCSITSGTEWNTGTDNGFGYSLQNIDANTVAFAYNDTSLNFKAKPFANVAAGGAPQNIFSSTTVANAEDTYVCYRLSVGATQQAGDYENQVIYTATATF